MQFKYLFSFFLGLSATIPAYPATETSCFSSNADGVASLTQVGLRRSPREVSGGKEEKERRRGRGRKAPQAHLCKAHRRDSGVLESLEERWKRAVLRQQVSPRQYLKGSQVFIDMHGSAILFTNQIRHSNSCGRSMLCASGVWVYACMCVQLIFLIQLTYFISSATS